MELIVIDNNEYNIIIKLFLTINIANDNSKCKNIDCKQKLIIL